MGMLYVGYLEGPFALGQGRHAGRHRLIFLRGDGAGGAVLAALGPQHLPPGGADEPDHAAVAGGASEARGSGPVDSADEIGTLAAHLDHLLDMVDEKTAQPAELGHGELDAKVAERTRELEPATPRCGRRSSSWCGRKSSPPSASSPPASPTRSTTRSP